MVMYTTVDSPLGELLVAGEEPTAVPGGVTVTSVSLSGRDVPADWQHVPAAFEDIRKQLAEYFAGTRIAFEFTSGSAGTAFQQRVWAALETIPYGTTTTYGRIAERLGVPRDRIRAVGAAVGANPLLILRPCHRVIGANGALTGYAGGVERKHFLLTHEGALQPQLT